MLVSYIRVSQIHDGNVTSTSIVDKARLVMKLTIFVVCFVLVCFVLYFFVCWP